MEVKMESYGLGEEQTHHLFHCVQLCKARHQTNPDSKGRTINAPFCTPELQSHGAKSIETKKGGKLGIFYNLPVSLGEDLGSQRWAVEASRNNLGLWGGEGSGSPLQYACLENPRDRGAWWAAVYGVTPSQTRLK